MTTVTPPVGCIVRPLGPMTCRMTVLVSAPALVFPLPPLSTLPPADTTLDQGLEKPRF